VLYKGCLAQFGNLCECYFRECLALFLPPAHAEIDWNRAPIFLDKELRQVTPDAELGLRRVDKPAQVWRQNGAEAWVLVHVEVQSQEDAAFAERMYVYNYRLYDRYRRRVVSLAVLGDERANWRPARFGYALWGCEVGVQFPTVKLLDYRARWAELEASRNPFAVVVMAHLKAQETQGDAAARKVAKWQLLRGLYERGYMRDDIVNLFQFIDWVMGLPEALEEALWQEIHAYEEAKRMPYVTSVERIGIKKGMELGIQQGIQQGQRQGLLDGITLGLELKWGADGLRLLPEIGPIADVYLLRAIHEGLKRVSTPDELRRIYQQPN
jgi:hypothetical protein